MSDAAATSTDTSNTDGNQTSETTSTAGDEFKAITSQEDLNKIISERVKRVEAKFGDYKDAKTKAAEYDKLAEANKSEIEKATERVTKAEAEVATIPTKVADALRTHLVDHHKIPADDAELFLTANDPELLLKQVTRLMGRESERKTKNNHVPNEGKNPPPAGGGDERAFVNSLWESAE